MTRNKCSQIYRYLHVCGDDLRIPGGWPGNGPLFKGRNMLDDLLPIFRNLYVMKKNNCIDESMAPFKGSIFFGEYIPSNRIRFGIKAWVLVESNTVYISEFSNYTGKSLDGTTHIDLAGTVVRQLTVHICNYGYYLYLDNYYTKVGLRLWYR